MSDEKDTNQAINELKERVDFLLNSELQAKETDYTIKEVLRDLLAEIFIFTYPDDPEERKKVEVKKYRELLEKLND